MKKILWVFLSVALVCLLLVSVAVYKNYQSNDSSDVYAMYLKKFNDLEGVAVVDSLLINDHVGNAHLVMDNGRKIQFAFLHQMDMMDKLLSRYEVFESNSKSFFLYRIDDVYARGECVLDVIEKNIDELPFADDELNLKNAIKYNEELYQLMEGLVGGEAYELKPKKFCKIEKALIPSTASNLKSPERLEI